jgi:hypothetical protein
MVQAVSLAVDGVSTKSLEEKERMWRVQAEVEEQIESEIKVEQRGTRGEH